ncbi:hypothetical protein CEP53_010486 [Fusarium sp. AF-6]|nr:hypothetical protein CEP53_010486 [Fusarium sp. AF-6]
MPNFPVVNGVSVLIPPPQGYAVNFEDPKQQCALAAYALWGSGTFVATLSFIQYLYVKLWLIRKWDIEAVFVILAWVLGNIDNALLGCKCPSKNCFVRSPIPFSDLLLIATIDFALFTDFSKLPLALFYRHLSPQTWWKRCTYVVIGLIIVYNTSIFFVLPSFQEALGSTMGIITDMILLTMPIPMVWGLQLPTRQKIGIIMFFFIGIGTVLTCVLRLIQFIPTLYSLDATWDITPTQLWIFPETSLLVICPCLTTLRRFLAHVAPTWVGMRGSSTGYTARSATGAGSRHPYLTVSSAGKRKRFDQFGLTVDEPAFNMKPMVQDETTEVVIEVNSKGTDGDKTSTGGIPSHENLTWDSRPGGEEFESEIAIVQTKAMGMSHT